ncbi:MAG: hypothetical protein WCQ54_11445 [Clostridiaceae bacterium]
MAFSEMKNNLCGIISIALSISALVLIVVNTVDVRTVLTVLSIALVCKCAAK